MISGYVVWAEGVRYVFPQGCNDPAKFKELLANPKNELRWFDNLDSDDAFYWNPGQKPKEKIDCWKEVMKDMENRRQFGENKYGKLVQPNSGENWKQHKYEELLDLLVYWKAEMLEEKNEC